VLSLPLEYAKLPFCGVTPTQSLKLTVNALTPEGEQIACLGVCHVDTTTSLQPSLNINVAGFGLGLSGLGCTHSSTQEHHQHIALFGLRGYPNTESFWEFKNDQLARYSQQVFLLIQFSSDHGTDEPFLFVLQFNSKSEVKLSRSWFKGRNKVVRQPAKVFDIKINGNWQWDVLKKRLTDTYICMFAFNSVQL
jgi:hypothetical protein